MFTDLDPYLFCRYMAHYIYLSFYNLVWWHAATLLIYFYINRVDIQYFIYTTRRAPLFYNCSIFKLYKLCSLIRPRGALKLNFELS
jgi:hypothetical protein